MIRTLATLAALACATAAAAQAPAAHVRADLVADAAAIRPGIPFPAVLRLRMEPGWHVYWRNPGDSGLPPTVAWTLPEGYAAGPFRWPAPERIPVPPMMNFGYEGDVSLVTEIAPPPGAALPSSLRIAGRVDYLACKVECVPGSAQVSLDIAPGGPSDPEAAGIMARALGAIPAPAPWPVGISRDGERLSLDVGMPEAEARAVTAAEFYPEAEDAIDHASPQPARADGTGLHVSLVRASQDGPVPSGLAGILVLEGAGRRAFSVPAGTSAAPVVAAGPARPSESIAPAAAPKTEAAPTFLLALGLALLGGLCLNLMPCVFPVLSIKVLGLVRQSGEDRGRVRLHGLSYAAGVLASFLGLAGTLMALKGAGGAAGWGFQLQSPIVVAGLAYLLLAIGLSLSGVFHVGGRAAGIGDGLARRGGLQGSFFAGVLATVVATPCTAPFMGTAVGYALAAGPAEGLSVFAGLGIGLAAPFLLLTLRPGLVRALPRPGAWMETLRQALAFPVYATAAWLVWVLSQQVGSDGFLAALSGLVLIGASAWAWGKGSDGGRGATAARALALAGVAAAIVLATGLRPGAHAGATLAAGSEPFSQERLDALTAAGRPVLVDMTAAWCITCKVNERTALADPRVLTAMSERGVTLLVGDWTNGDPGITRLLEAQGRAGVPLYLLYSEGARPVALPQILTPGIVLDALSRVPAKATGLSARG